MQSPRSSTRLLGEARWHNHYQSRKMMLWKNRLCFEQLSQVKNLPHIKYLHLSLQHDSVWARRVAGCKLMQHHKISMTGWKHLNALSQTSKGWKWLETSQPFWISKRHLLLTCWVSSRPKMARGAGWPFVAEISRDVQYVHPTNWGNEHEPKALLYAWTLWTLEADLLTLKCLRIPYEWRFLPWSIHVAGLADSTISLMFLIQSIAFVLITLNGGAGVPEDHPVDTKYVKMSVQCKPFSPCTEDMTAAFFSLIDMALKKKNTQQKWGRPRVIRAYGIST